MLMIYSIFSNNKKWHYCEVYKKIWVAINKTTNSTSQKNQNKKFKFWTLMCKYSTKKIANSTPFSASSWFFKVCILFIRGLEKSSQHFLSISASFDIHNDCILNMYHEWNQYDYSQCDRMQCECGSSAWKLSKKGK